MEQTDIQFSPFAQIESDGSVRGASNVGLSLYNQMAYVRYMRRLTVVAQTRWITLSG